ncbi:MAG TPA: ferritin-like domain-containing protein [Tepidisphaeraceae bacterium]|nr:ferritin-like domain-containing protein [Tepidisphaeraceae bacterium]
MGTSEAQKGTAMTEKLITPQAMVGRRTLLRTAAVAGVVALAGETAQAKKDRDNDRDDDREHGRLTRGDAAILRFLAAAEILETDLWQQYNELGGIQDDEVPGGSGNPAYTEALAVLDEDMAQYIHDNTENEMTHELFLNAYLEAHGAEPADLERFRTLPSSQATGAQQIGRLTNLMRLTLDTSWWSRYRDPSDNPDLDPDFIFPQAVPDLHNGQFPGIPRTDADLAPAKHLQAIANTAGFHFPSVEVGGTSLYPSLAQRITGAEALRVVLSIGPTEAMHFQTWQDKAGNAPPLTDPTNGLTFPDLSNAGELLQSNLIMPEPCPFLSTDLPICSIVRPTETKGAAKGALAYLTAMGIFRGQSAGFFAYMRGLAADADAARRGGP